MPDAVYVVVRCLQPGCTLGEQRSSVGLELTDTERLETAEGFVFFAARSCRQRHAAGVEARFTDDPRKILFSRAGWCWAAS